MDHPNAVSAAPLHRTMAARLLPVVLGVALISCQAPSVRPDYARYERVYDSPSTLCMRGILKCLPYVSEHAFHGRYGGCGNSGGKPIDALDSLCRKHDILYIEAKALPTLRMVDEVFVEKLRELPTTALTTKQRDFRERGIRFMESPWADILGKPFENLGVCHEPPESPFQDKESIRRFFHAKEGLQEMELLRQASSFPAAKSATR